MKHKKGLGILFILFFSLIILDVLYSSIRINTPKPAVKLTVKEACLKTYTSFEYSFTFAYNACYFGEATGTVGTSLNEPGCGTPEKPAEVIVFEKSPLFIHLNQQCGIYFESSGPVIQKYQLPIKSGQIFDVIIRESESIYVGEAFSRNQNYAIELNTKVEPQVYKNMPELVENINHILSTMEFNYLSP